MKTHRTYSLNKKKLKETLIDLGSYAGAVGICGGIIGMGAFAIFRDLDQEAQSELMHEALSENFNGKSFRITGPESVVYRQSSESEVSFHFDSNTIIVKHESAEEAARIYNFSEFEAQGLIEKSRESGCDIAQSFVNGKAEIEQKLTAPRFDKLDERLSFFASQHCDFSIKEDLIDPVIPDSAPVPEA